MLALLLLSSITFDMTQEVDLLELNSLYDNNDQRVFEQMIYYEWDRVDNRYHVVDWRLLKHRGMIPIKQGRYYETIWMDGDQLRRVRAKYYRKTWSRTDPEIGERERLPKDQRRGLIKWPTKKKTTE